MHVKRDEESQKKKKEAISISPISLCALPVNATKKKRK